MDGELYWREVIYRKYGCAWSGWCSNVVQGFYGIKLWKFIRKGWENIASYVRFARDEVSRIRFSFGF